MNRSVTVIPPKRRVGNTITKEEKPKLKVAAYCRVSTDSEEQASSYEMQVEHYKAFMQKNEEWQFAGIFADDGISGTNTKKRSEFNRMIEECMAGHIDMIITKSISRFARNTVDCLNYIRKLKDKNIHVFFEKENINTMDAKGEVLLTIMLDSRNDVFSADAYTSRFPDIEVKINDKELKNIAKRIGTSASMLEANEFSNSKEGD